VQKILRSAQNDSVVDAKDDSMRYAQNDSMGYAPSDRSLIDVSAPMAATGRRYTDN